MAIQRGDSMKIYIITKRDYSDYYICNVTTDYEKAKRYKEAYSDYWGKACIEVYEDGENGKENYCWVYNPISNTAEISDHNVKKGIRKIDGKICGVYVYAPDEKHAITMGQDMIATYKAQQVRFKKAQDMIVKYDWNGKRRA